MENHIIIYEQTEKTCMPCKMTKRYLDERNIPYKVIDGNKHLDQLRNEGFTSFPVVKTPIGAWCGYAPNRLQHLSA